MHHDGSSPRPTPTGSLDALAPIAGFLVINRVAGLRWAVAVTTVAAVVVVVRRRRRGHPLGVAAPLVTAAFIARGALAIAFDSQDLYFGLGIAGKYALGAAIMATTVIGRPAAAHLAPLVFELPADVSEHPAWLRAMRRASLVGGLYYLLSATIDVVLYRSTSIEGYLIVRLLANWPIAAVALGVAWLVCRGPIRSIPDLDSLRARFEAKWDASESPHTMEDC